MWLENKYIGLVSVRLPLFKKKSNGYNFRCPFCGDSQVSKTKTRGWIYQNKGRNRYHCFNCSVSLSFDEFLKNIDQSLYSQYKIEAIAEKKSPDQIEYEEFIEKLKPKKFITNSPLKYLKKISQLNHDDPIKQYIVNRNIPTPYHAKLFKCPNYMHWVNSILPNKFSEEAIAKDETRLLIPFISKDNVVHAAQFRSLKKNANIKYVTIILDESIPKIYGLDTVDLNKKIYVFEGPFDSMFIKNSIATAGGDMISTLRSLEAYKNNIIIVYDNEPRSKETKKKIDKSIMNGYNVCIWPENLEHKDVNDMITVGLSSEFIKHIIDGNTYRDLAAKLALTKWSKV